MSRLLLLISVAILVISCGNRDSNLSLHLKWKHQAQFAGFYMMKECLDREGMSINLVPGGPHRNSLEAILSGASDYAVSSADAVIRASMKGAPIVAILPVFSRSPVVFFTRKSSGILTIEDFRDKTVGMQYGTNVHSEYKMLLGLNEVPQTSIREYPSGLNIRPFLTGIADVWNGYEFHEPLVAEREGLSLNIIRLSDHGVSTYGDVLVTTENKIRENRKEVQTMVNCSIKGWRIAISDKKNTVEKILTIDSTLDGEHQSKMLSIVSELATHEENLAFDQQLLNEMVELTNEYVERGRVKSITNLFTNQFVNGYLNEH